MPRNNHPKKRKTIYRKGNERPKETYRKEDDYWLENDEADKQSKRTKSTRKMSAHVMHGEVR